MLPESLTEEAVARMLYDGAPKCVLYDWGHAKAHARAVLALCEAKVRDCVAMVRHEGLSSDEVIARVFGRGEESRG